MKITMGKANAGNMCTSWSSPPKCTSLKYSCTLNEIRSVQIVSTYLMAAAFQWVRHIVQWRCFGHKSSYTPGSAENFFLLTACYTRCTIIYRTVSSFSVIRSEYSLILRGGKTLLHMMNIYDISHTWKTEWKQVKLLQCYLYSVIYTVLLHFLYMIFIDSYDISLMLVYIRTKLTFLPR